MDNKVNVIVVGGGAAGLAAAVELEALGLTCQIVEAQARLGGRIDSVEIPGGGIFDRGAQMINGDMTAVLGLARRAGLHCAPVPRTGQDLCVLDGEVMPREELVSNDEIEDLLLAQLRRWDSPGGILRALWSSYQWWVTPWEDLGEARRGVVRAIRGDTAPKGSLAEAIGKMLLCDEDAAIAASVLCEQYGAAPETRDARAVLTGLERYASRRDDMEFQLPGGMSRIVACLAAQLAHRPRLDAPVSRVRNVAKGVEVAIPGKILRADSVIIAVPPPVARRITFEIARADDLATLLAAFGSGDTIKMALSYDRAFWRLNGLSGHVAFATPQGLMVADTSSDNGALPQLTAFVGGPLARDWASLLRGERIDRLLFELEKPFGREARAPRHVAEAVWVDDPWCGGGYNAAVRTGHRSDAADRLAGWAGPVRFAGAELDVSFAGYVEGALRSGRAAARDLAMVHGIVADTVGPMDFDPRHHPFEPAQ